GAADFGARREGPEVQVPVRPAPEAAINPLETATAQGVAAVGRDGEGPDGAAMALETVKLATRRDVPDLETRAEPGDHDPRAVGRHRQAIDPVVGADPALQLAPAGYVPDADRPVVPTGDGARPVGEEDDTGHVRSVADQAAGFPRPGIGVVQG